MLVSLWQPLWRLIKPLEVSLVLRRQLLKFNIVHHATFLTCLKYIRLDTSCRDVVKNVVHLRRDAIKRGNEDIIDDPPTKKVKLVGDSRSAEANSVKDLFNYLMDGDNDHTIIMPPKKKRKSKISLVPFGAEVIHIISSPEPGSRMDQLD